MLHKARAFALNAHGDQMYGEKPYIYHLDKVAALLADFGEDAQIIGYLHDVLEDTKTSYVEIERSFSSLVAECVSLLTDESGDSRAERKVKTYAKLAMVEGSRSLALIVKTADRLANVDECIAQNNQKLLSMYRQEHLKFKEAVFRPSLCDGLWFLLDSSIDLTVAVVMSTPPNPMI
jgi:guanosine-3',5'-bis(diphosphate) 3'-pyrophosphohydrolase